jgi:Glycosyl transferase family 11.
MIIVKLIGGLGNQLFQYAAAYSLSRVHQTNLKIDITAFKDYKLRSPELEKFNLDLQYATSNEINNLKTRGFIDKLINFISSEKRKKEYKEKFFHFDNKFFQLGSNVYLSGYFQSEKYFYNVKEELRNKLNLSLLNYRVSNTILNDINSNNSIAIHVRISDYAKPENNEYHGILSSVYYKAAIQYLQNKFPHSKYYVFSDDLEKANQLFENINIIKYQLIETGNSLTDFYLMSQCKHNIIANSSFSWWAAWLNPNPDKMVIAPKNWFNKGPQDTQDLFPPSWTLI